ncbi:alpha/beta hydrolase [Comamonas sp.]|uniref:alpha/beta hydrolase n=1 Tax=Comamonas sp. TaxID=34028 RepID=UPI003D0DCB73
MSFPRIFSSVALIAGLTAGNAQAAAPASQADSRAAFQTQAWGASGRIANTHYAVEQVRFLSQGTEIVGNLLLPSGHVGPRPAVAVMGPVGFVKEQSPMQYATRLAREGFVVLVFDPRYHGESAGTPRRLESGAAKTQDLQAALEYLAQRAEVDSAALHLLGICQGVNWAVDAAITEPRVRSVALVAGHYLTPQTALMYLGSEQEIERRAARSQAALKQFQESGAVDYIPVVSERPTPPNPDALLKASAVQQFYSRWANRHAFWNFHGLWENRIAMMSEAGIWGHRADQAMAKLSTPTLMVHADRAASGPDIPRRLFASIPAASKELVWLGQENQMQFYEDPITLDHVTPELTRFYHSQTVRTR